jgi:hypothetical protein
LLLLTSVIIAAELLLITSIKLNIRPGDLLILTGCLSFIAGISLYIFFLGQKKEPSDSVIYLLVAISVKMLLEMIFALIWFFVAKKNSVPSLILFFVLYLAFSMFSIILMLKTLKNRSL